MFNWLFGKREAQAPQTPKARKSLFSTHEFDSFDPDNQKFKIADTFAALQKQQPALYGEYAMDDSSNGVASFKMYAAGNNTVSDAVIGWYASQGFIGAQLCGILAQNWLINKACSMPADDAIRKGYNIVTTDGDELDPEAVKIMKAYDKAFKLNYNMKEFIRKGRIFGVRVAMFKVNSTDPLYYEKPFNIDGVTAGSYKGIVQVDPYWTAPMLDGAAASQPDTLHFYEPTWWMINGKKVHRSHLIIFRHAEPVDVLKPQYIYGGVPLTQQIMERVYAAERVSNEAPQLAMSKRTTVWLTDMEAVMADTNAAIGRLQQWAAYRDNFGVKLGDKDGDEFQQFDTSLADFDALIMTQYQLVSAIAGVPATKLMGTSPKGFGASGEYEEASYHELLESIQTNDLTPFAERHHQLVIRAYVEPQLKKKFDLETTLNWLPLDTPTAQELAATNLSKAQTGQTLIASGAISSEDERQRVATDKESGYNEIGLMEEESPQGEELAEEDFEKVSDSDIPPQQDPEDGEGKSSKFETAQDDGEHWITLNGKSKKEEGAGSHVLISGEGKVMAGAGGKLNGEVLKNVRTKSGNVEKHGPVVPQLPQKPEAGSTSGETGEAPKGNEEPKTNEEPPKELSESEKLTQKADSLSKSAQTEQEHWDARNAHVSAANSMTRRGNPEQWAHHVAEVERHEKAIKKLKSDAKRELKKSLNQTETGKAAKKIGEKFQSKNSDEINNDLKSEFNLGFENGAGSKKEAEKKWDEYFKAKQSGEFEKADQLHQEYRDLKFGNRNLGFISKTQQDVNKNDEGAKATKKLLGHVHNALSDLQSRGFDVKAALAQGNVSYGSIPAARGSIGTAWQLGDKAVFTISNKLLDPTKLAEYKQNAENRKARGMPRWTVDSGTDEIINSTIIHEIAHALGMQKHINSPKKLQGILSDLYSQGKLSIPESSGASLNSARAINEWVKHNVSEYATENYKETDAEVCAMVCSPNYVKGTLPKEIEDHVYDLFKGAK